MKFNKDVKLILSPMGASLVQTLIAFGMVGGLALIMMQINERGAKSAKSFEARTALRDYINEITSRHITDGPTCTNNFSQTGPNNVTRTDIATALPNLYDGNGAVFLSLNDLILKDVYQVTGITLLPQNNTTGEVEGICSLQLQFTVQNNAIMGPQVQNHEIDFYCSVDPAGMRPITNCYPSTTTTYSSLWNLTLISGDEYINWTPSSGLGAVVIGDMSVNPSTNDTAALNLNMNGPEIATPGVGLREGISFAYNNAMSFGNWFLVGEDIGTEQFISLRFWDETVDDQEQFHYGMVIHQNFLEFPAYQNDYSNPSKTSRNSLHVRGDAYVWQGISPASKFAGLGHTAFDQVVALGMGPAINTGTGTDFTNDGDTAAMWGMRQGGYPGNKGESENYFVMTPNNPTPVVTAINNEDIHMQSGMRVRPGPLVIFSGDTVVNSCAACIGSWMMGQNLSLGDLSNSAMLLGDNHVARGKHQLVTGRDFTKAGAMLTDYAFLAGDGLTVTNGGEYQFAVGDIDQISVTTDNANGDHVFTAGQSTDTQGSFTFNVGLGNVGYADQRYSTNLGIATSYTLGQHSVGDYPLFSIGQHFSLMSGGGLHMQTGENKFAANLPSTPSRLFLGGARSLRAGSPDDYAVIGHNYYRYCATGTSNCQFYRSPGGSTSFGSAFIYFGDTEVFFGSIPNSGSSNEARNEVNDNISSSGLVSFNSNEFNIPGDLEGYNMYTREISCGSGPTPSDRKLKKDIESLSEKELDLFWQLNPVEFEMKKYPGKKVYGFIAQEVQKLFPNLVRKNEKSNFLGLNYRGFYALLVQAFQFLLDFFEQIEGDFNQLKVEVKELFLQAEDATIMNQRRLEFLEKRGHDE